MSRKTTSAERLRRESGGRPLPSPPLLLYGSLPCQPSPLSQPLLTNHGVLWRRRKRVEIRGRDRPQEEEVSRVQKNDGSDNRVSILKRSKLSPCAPSPALPTQKPPVIFFGRNFTGRSMRGHPPLPVRKFIYHLSRRALVLLTPEFNTSKRCSNPTCREVLKTVMVRRFRCPKKREATKILYFRRFHTLEINLLTPLETVPPFHRNRCSIVPCTSRGSGRGSGAAALPEKAARPKVSPFGRAPPGVQGSIPCREPLA